MRCLALIISIDIEACNDSLAPETVGIQQREDESL